MKSLKQKNYIIAILIMIGLAIIAFVMGSLFDWDIANKIHMNYPFTNSAKVNAPVFSVVLTSGIIPSCFFTAFAGTALVLSKRKNLFFRWVWRIGGVVGFGLTIYSTYDSCLETIDIYTKAMANADQIKVFIIALIAFVNIMGIYFALVARNQSDQNKLFWVSLTIMILMAIYYFGGEAIKYMVSRPRPRTIYNVPALEEFRSWWEARPLYALKIESASSCKSFVSGHVANTANYMFMLPAFLSVFKIGEKKWTKVIAFAVAACYVVMVGISRMYAQAHFLTDVAGGMLTSLLIGLLAIYIMPIIEEKIDNKKAN